MASDALQFYRQEQEKARKEAEIKRKTGYSEITTIKPKVYKKKLYTGSGSVRFTEGGGSVNVITVTDPESGRSGRTRTSTTTTTVSGVSVQGKQPSLQEATGVQRYGTTTRTEDRSQLLRTATSRLTPRDYSQQAISRLYPQERRTDPNRYGANEIRPAKTGAVEKGKFILSNLNQKVSSYMMKFKSKDPVTKKEDYIVGGTNWIDREMTQSKKREEQINLKLEDAKGIRKTVLKAEMFRIKAGQFMLGAEAGARQTTRTKPVTVATNTLAFGALPKVFGLVGTGVSRLGTMTGLSSVPIVTKTASFTSRALGVGLTGGYALGVGARVGRGGSAFESGKIGGTILTKEVVPMAVGGALGSRFWRWQESSWATRGRKEIQVERLVPEDALSGRNRFPLSRGGTSQQIRRTQLNMFETQSQRLPIEKYTGSRYELGTWKDVSPSQYHVRTPGSLYHTTGNRNFLSKEFKTEQGFSEFGGLYGSYGVSPHFARVDGSVGKLDNVFGASLFQPYNKPGVAAITPTGFRAQAPLKYPITKNIPWTSNIKNFQGVAGTPTGRAYIPGYKTEVEAILPTGTTVTRAGQKYFFKYNNVKIPIDQFTTGTGNVLSNAPRSATGFSSLYGGVGSYPTLTSSSLGAGFVSSLRSLSSSSAYSVPSLSSYRGSTSSSRTSYPISSTSSITSYRGSSMTSFGSFGSYFKGSSYSPPRPPSKPPIGESYISSPPRSPPGKPPSTPIYFKAKTNGKKKKKTSTDIYNPFNPRYFSSVEANVLNVRGKTPSKFKISTGLGLRPIKL
jgi:hypothetical protein